MYEINCDAINAANIMPMLAKEIKDGNISYLEANYNGYGVWSIEIGGVIDSIRISKVFSELKESSKG